MIASSSVCMPYFFPTCSMPGIWNVLAWRIRFEMAGVEDLERGAASLTSTRLKRVCATTLSGLLKAYSGSGSVARPGTRRSRGRLFLRARSVQGSEYKVSCRCGFKRQLDCFEVTHFADEDDIGILAQCTASLHQSSPFSRPPKAQSRAIILR